MSRLPRSIQDPRMVAVTCPRCNRDNLAWIVEREQTYYYLVNTLKCCRPLTIETIVTLGEEKARDE